jgi:AcrR family transcriptional regulator
MTTSAPESQAITGAPDGAPGTSTTATTATTVERLRADERRERLMDVTRELVVEIGPHAINIGAVADRADVTRALVYKHFDNKDDLLLAVYRREAKRLDKQIRRTVEAAPPGLTAKVRSYIAAAIDAIDEHAPFFAPLQDARTDPSVRRDRRGWDSRSVTYFADLALEEYDLDPATARAVVAVMLTGTPAVLAGARNGIDERAVLEEIYVESFLGALDRLARRF